MIVNKRVETTMSQEEKEEEEEQQQQQEQQQQPPLPITRRVSSDCRLADV